MRRNWRRNPLDSMSTNNKRIVLAGGSGFIGSALAADWLAQNGEVVVLTRSPHGRTDGVIECEWDGEHLGEWIKYLEEAEAVIGLAGKNINCRHTPDNVQDLADSRVKSVRAIAVGLDHATRPPRVWIQASGIGFYGDQQDKLCDENSPTGSDALAGICCQWEGAFYSARPKKTRKVLLRIGFALGRNGGGLPVLAKLTKWFLGAGPAAADNSLVGSMSRIWCGCAVKSLCATIYRACSTPWRRTL